MYNLYLSQEYYKATGKYYYRQLPQTDVRWIIAVIVIVLSVLLPSVQYQRYQTALAYLRYATVNNLTIKEGGSKQTMTLFLRASAEFEAKLSAGFSKCNKLCSYVFEIASYKSHVLLYFSRQSKERKINETWKNAKGSYIFRNCRKGIICKPLK